MTAHVESVARDNEPTSLDSAEQTTFFGDLWSLTKPGIATMVGLTAMAGFLLPRQEIEWLQLTFVVVGTYLLAGAASALNMVAEAAFDARMDRTSSRPIPSGRLQVFHASLFSTVLSCVGAVLLAAVDLWALIAGVATLVLYVAVYTPLKRVTHWSTWVGALPGALPPLIGWLAATHALGWPGLTLFGVLFFWQLPHFFAIAWMYRDDYQRGGFPMLPVIDPSGQRTARQSIATSILLLATSLVLVPLGSAGAVYLVTAVFAGGLMVHFSWRFAASKTRARARHLLLMSIGYLPLLFTGLLLDRLIV